jgi:predicted RNase H-like HicB family nuclease
MSQTLRLTAPVVPDGDWFVARCVKVGVASQGRSIEEALANLRKAHELYYQDEPAPEALPEPIVAAIEVRRSA